MITEILTIGDEILSGNILNSNVAYLSDKLWLHGIEVEYHSSVRDDPDRIREALTLAVSRADLVLVSGGLGPTADDFTIEIAAKTFRKKLLPDDKALRHLESLYKQWGRPLKDNDKKQAYVPQGAKTFLNKIGTAPGIGVTFKKVRFYFLPGVPRELKQLFEDFILPEIIANQDSPQHFQSKMIKCFGLPESDLDAAIKDLYVNRLNIEQVRIGFRAHFPDTFIKLSAWHKDAVMAKKLLSQALEKIRERVGNSVYGEEKDSLESVVGSKLTKQKRTLSVAESCTGGLLSHRITNVPGSSEYFKNGIVSYSNEAKQKVLGVSAETLKKYGEVSSQCAVEMAQGVRRICRTDYGIAITGIAGPGGGSPQKPVGTVHVALATPQGIQEKKYFLPYSREAFKLLTSSIALDKLRREITGKAN